MSVQLSYSMPRGDSRSLPIAVPVSTYLTGMKIFFTLKIAIDNTTDDNLAVLKKTLTDTDITSRDASNVNYLLLFLPIDTNLLAPATYVAEFEIVHPGGNTVITYPDPEIAQWNFKITPEVTRRVT